MKKQFGIQNKKSLNYLHRFSIFIIPLIIGIGIMITETFYHVVTSYVVQVREISEYETHIKERIQEEVVKAIQIAEFYYSQNQESLSDEEIKQNLVTLLGQLQSEDVGYYFASNYDGYDMLGPGAGNYVYDVEDKNGMKVVQELIKTAKSGGGYVTYVMPAFEDVEQAPKISYVLPFEPFGWYIGAGVNLSEIDTIKEQIRADTIKETLQSLLVTSIMVAILMLIFWRINDRLYCRIESEILLISDYLDKSTTGIATLELDKLNFIELDQIGRHTVNLVQKRDEIQTDLEAINESLEEEVAEHAITIDELNASQSRFESIVKTIPDAIFIMGSNGEFIDCETNDKNPMNIPKNCIGENVRDVLPEPIAKSCVECIRRALLSNKLETHEFHLGSGDLVEYYEARITKFQADQVFTIMRNTTDIKKYQMTNEYLSYHDQLTGTYNRRYFEEALIRLDAPKYLPIALAMVDVNGLKLTNDAFGHRTGDRLLCQIADILQKQCKKPDDFIARIGGDEFVIVCPNTNPREMEKLIKNINASMSKERKKNSTVSISAGWDIKSDVKQNMTDIFNKAEEIMYSKKLSDSQSFRHQTVQAILKTLNEKNVREKIHSERVSVISRLIGEALELDYSTVREIETAGLLHDIGKVVVDEHILNKQGPLNDEEYDKIKKHPESSYQILKSINAYAGLAEDVLSHHERMDGGGYPRRLKGEEISLIARIISIADAYEAMTSDRSYRLALSKEEAMSELNRCAGTQFDANIVLIFEQKVLRQL